VAISFVKSIATTKKPSLIESHRSSIKTNAFAGAGLTMAESLFGLVNSAIHAHIQPPLQMKNKLRELRAAKAWSQSDLADKLGVSRQTINAIETEKYDPSLPLAFKMARLFKLSIEQIFTSDND
jgi:putative transcriptional regulator